jgi:hypothetical protein
MIDSAESTAVDFGQTMVKLGPHLENRVNKSLMTPLIK